MFSYILGGDFFKIRPKGNIDYVISNPPYSLKTEVFERLFKLGTPFAMLVGVVGLFESQKRFDGFIGSSGKSYQYDFYLPDYNCCVEYDGIQHYCGWGKDSQSLLNIQRRDKAKDDFCLTHNISLVRIPYYCYDNITEESIRDLVKEIANGRLPQIYTYRENK